MSTAWQRKRERRRADHSSRFLALRGTLRALFYEFRTQPFGGREAACIQVGLPFRDSLFFPLKIVNPFLDSRCGDCLRAHASNLGDSFQTPGKRLRKMYGFAHGDIPKLVTGVILRPESLYRKPVGWDE